MNPIDVAQTVLYFSLTVAVAYLCGYGVVKLLLPDDLKGEHQYIVMPIVGYMVFCLLSFTVSGTFGMSVSSSIWTTMGALSLFAIVMAYTKKSADSNLGQSAKKVLALVLPALLVLMWPLFWLGGQTYLGAVNPDYFAGFLDNYYLGRGHGVASFVHGFDTHKPIDYLAGSISHSGRFGSGMFALLLETLFPISTRFALTLSISLFIACLPLSVYFMAREAFGHAKPVATLAAWLMGISGPIAMSYLYFYLGQNSGLAALPLTLTVLYLLVTQPTWKNILLGTLLANALFVIYLGMLPYALAPVGALGLYMLGSKKMSWKTAVYIVLSIIGLSLLLRAGMLGHVKDTLFGWSNVVGQTLQGQFFLEFLTEAFFPLMYGIVVYPPQSSMYFSGYAAVSVLIGLSVLISGFWIWALWDWARRNSDGRRVVLAVAAVIIYLAVWWVYSFQRQYAYAVFKMAAWLQFIFMPFVAYGIYRLWGMARGNRQEASSYVAKGVFGLFALVLIGGNLLTSFNYGVHGLGHSVGKGYIVNNFEMSGNHDYFGLQEAVSKVVRPDESIGLSFVDSIQNFWVAYYLRGSRLSLLSHENIPGDDENLPDVQSNMVVDYYGNVREATNVFFHGATDDYYLMWNESHINKEITQPTLPEPLWQDHTFRLFKASDVPDFIFAGRGFYRMEYRDKEPEYWWPERWRWSAEGGEVYMLRAAKPGHPYRLAFDAIAGYELDKGSRTIELWHNKQKFDEVVVNGAARVISKPFYPSGAVDKLVLKIREKTQPTPRKKALWNNDVPADYRKLNAAFANIRVLTEGNSGQGKGGAASPLQGKEILESAVSFNGVEVDGWIRESMSLTVAKPKSASKIDLQVEVPGNLGFTFPYAFEVKVDGVARRVEADAPGRFTISMPVDAAHELVDMEIKPSQYKEAEEFSIRRRQVARSVHLKSLAFQ